MYKNYLLFVASLAHQNATVRYCKGLRHDGVFSGLQTNVAPSQYFQAILASKGEKLEKIIIMATKEVRENKIEVLGNITTIEYYTQQILKQALELNISFEHTDELFAIIPYDTSEADDVSDILKPIIAILESTNSEQSNQRLYIDFTGGSRTASMALVFAARFLAAKDIEIANIIYVNLLYGSGSTAENPAPIEECIKTYDTFDLFAGLAESKASENRRVREFSKKHGKKGSDKLLQKVNQATVMKKAGQTVEAIEHEPIDTGNVILDAVISEKVEEVNIDLWTQIYRSAEREEFLAFNQLNVSIMKLLKESGKLEYIGKKDGDGTSELFANYLYYEKYIAYAQTLLEHISNAVGGPLDAAKEFTRETFRLSHYMNNARDIQVFMNDYMNRTFNKECVKDIKENQEYLADGVKSLISSGTEISGEIVIKLVDEYNSDLRRMQGIYFSYGFPFACVAKDEKNRTSIFQGYDRIYRNALNRSVNDINKLYSNGGNYMETPGLRKLFQRLGSIHRSYDELIGLCITDDDALRALFPVQFNKWNYKSGKWDKDWQIADFMYEFLPLYAKTRDFRNKVTHPEKITQLGITSEELHIAYKRIIECLELIRN